MNTDKDKRASVFLKNQKEATKNKTEIDDLREKLRANFSDMSKIIDKKQYSEVSKIDTINASCFALGYVNALMFTGMDPNPYILINLSSGRVDRLFEETNV